MSERPSLKIACSALLVGGQRGIQQAKEGENSIFVDRNGAVSGPVLTLVRMLVIPLFRMPFST